jgi:adenylyl cyclase-associated protein
MIPLVQDKRTLVDSQYPFLPLHIQVTKDKQTWRKEFKKDETKTVLPAAPSLDTSQAGTKKKEKKKPLLGLPIFEYQDRGFKWVVENHTKESVVKEASKDGVITVEISDPKQQVYLYNCEGITVKVNGKFKSLVLDKCDQCAVVYDTLISSAEMVNCKKIQLQVNGVCPVFTIDKTVNVLIWLSKESLAVSTFTTSLSSEMNVSFPDGDDQKELPIPEQFVHKLTDGSLSSDVSDLYH